MACRKLFWKNSLCSLRYLQTHWENVTDTSFEDIRDIIRKNIDFNVCDHKGPMYPMFYTFGIPSFMWTCRKCLGQTSSS